MCTPTRIRSARALSPTKAARWSLGEPSLTSAAFHPSADRRTGSNASPRATSVQNALGDALGGPAVVAAWPSPIPPAAPARYSPATPLRLACRTTCPAPAAALSVHLAEDPRHRRRPDPEPDSGHASRQSLEIYSRLALADAQRSHDEATTRLPVCRSSQFAAGDTLRSVGPNRVGLGGLLGHGGDVTGARDSALGALSCDQPSGQLCCGDRS